MAVALLGLLDCGTLRAQVQMWEWIYGDTNRLEDGKFRVIPVTGTCSVIDECCITGYFNGYIAVGTSAPASTSDMRREDVHVVRTDNFGRRVWECTYDITGNNDNDSGYSVIELRDGSGFVIAGETRYQNGGSDAFLLKVDCAGVPVWSRTYGGPFADGGRDLIEAQTGNPQVGTNAGDIVVAGFSYGPGPVVGTRDGYLFRTTNAGIMIWDGVYNFSNQTDFFYSLTETTPIVATMPTGDIVAVGHTHTGTVNSHDALVVRVNGDNGIIGGAPQGGAIYRSTRWDEFSSVIELQNPAERGTNGRQNVVLSGIYNGIDILVVKLDDGDPCRPLVQRVIFSNPTGSVVHSRTIREVTFVPGLGAVAQWDLVLTGTFFTSAQSDALLLSLAPGNLAPGTLAAIYGSTGNEEGWSLYPVDSTLGSRTFGFVLCGHSTGNWYNPPPLLPQSAMYLVKTDGFGATGCEDTLVVDSSTVSIRTCVTIGRKTIRLSITRATADSCIRWGLLVCPRPTGVSCRPAPDQQNDARLLPGGLPGLPDHVRQPAPENLSDPRHEKWYENGSGEASDNEMPGVEIGRKPETQTAQSRTGQIVAYPNPVKAGDPIRLSPGVGEGATVSVVNTSGERIGNETTLVRNEEGEGVLRTVGWIPGVYFLTLRSRAGVQSTIRVVVVE